MTESRWYLVLAAAVATLTVVGVLTAPGPTLAGDGPYGTLALERIASDLGFDVSRGTTPPSDGTFVLVDDFRAEDDARSLLQWAADGGRLVVADPGSNVLDLLDVAPSRRLSGQFTGTTDVQPSCGLPEVADVATIRFRASDRRLAPGEPGTGVATCADSEGGDPFLVVVDVGRGDVVLIGGSSPLQNELLADADNALFMLRLLGTSDRVVLGTAAVDPPPTGLWAALPDAGRALLVAGLLAALVVAAAAWRRLGVPVAEPAPTAIAASGLVEAVAGLYRESGDRAHVARRLQEHVGEVVRRRTGLPADATPDDVAHVLADLLGADVAGVRTALTRQPDDEDHLVALAIDLHRILDHLEGR